MKYKQKSGFSGLFFKGKPVYFDPKIESGIMYFIKTSPETIDMDIVWKMREMANAIEGKKKA